LRLFGKKLATKDTKGHQQYTKKNEVSQRKQEKSFFNFYSSSFFFVYSWWLKNVDVAISLKISCVSPQSESVSTRPAPALFLAVALLSAAVLGYEVALSRVFAVLLRYQFAFLIVSLALCGLGLGGLLAHRFRHLALDKLALWWGALSAVSLGIILRGVFPIIPQHYWVAALVVLLPFIAAGAFLALAFERHAASSGRLYAFDLAGAALAAAGSVLLMQGLGAVNACLAFGALGAFVAVLLAKNKAFPLLFALLLAALIPYNARFGLWSVQPIPPTPDKNGATLSDRGVTQPLYTELGDKSYGSRIVDTRWNAFARTDVVTDPQSPDSFLLYTNGNVPTNMLNWNGKLYELPRLISQFPISDWTFANSNLEGKRVMSIGPGGGLDALLALRYGADRFDGAEINPSIVELMNEPKYKAYNGGIYSHPKVHVEVAEGRAFVREARQKGVKYQLIFSALTKTATAGQGGALLESFIYTTDAFDDYLATLEPNGQLAIVGDATPLLARLYATAFQHFTDLGQTTAQAGAHIAVVYYPQPGPYQWALIVRPNPIPPTDAARMKESAEARGIYPLWIPGQASSNEIFPFGALGGGALTMDGFIASGLTLPGAPPLDLSPAPDNRPFVLDLSTSPWAIFTEPDLSNPLRQRLSSLAILLGLSLVATLLFAATLLGLGARHEKRALGGAALQVGYFLALGVGFMLVEIPLIEKLILPLGYPTLSLTVILGSILLGGGAGAGFSQRFEGDALRAHAQACALGVAIFAALFGVVAGAFSNLLLPLPLPVRCALTALVLLPLGFLLGTPFPAGLRLWSAKQREGFVPLVWALNGTASVLGSIVAAVAAKQIGFGAVLSLGAVFYLGVAGVLALVKKEA